MFQKAGAHGLHVGVQELILSTAWYPIRQGAFFLPNITQRVAPVIVGVVPKPAKNSV